VEIVGKVNQDLSVKVLKATDMGRDGEFFLSYSSGWSGELGLEGDGEDLGENCVDE
jgi:hypothetical protein